ncbi:hypothetical protein PFICI_01043 [Pestalotiopsis fici W106-1]|uniref:Uncharacterized protein n=1 Tax=Pestalotiopsis fici (strain W106-1 / CGMCC3.15140) TaxID=1229662 RepID=W3XMP3_PESFW|nr:uncharacterized protein PFICI_01043 [Pestalotiopsis fici W106-1]ETS87215.1 hypothetical protein PFICI_01043 [Pestalotiopsis fici W106-1]
MAVTQVIIGFSQHILSIIFIVADIIATACAFVETLLPWAFDLPSTTTFRAFTDLSAITVAPDFAPDFADTIPEYAQYARVSALVWLLSAPCLAIVEARLDFFRSPVGTLLHPWTKKSRRVACVIMAVRIWLLLATYNAIVSQFFQTGDLLRFAVTVPFCVMSL